MPRYSHPDLLDNGLAYLKANCNKAILITAYSTDYATVNGANKIAEAALVTGDFSIAGADGAARVLTAALSGKAAGNALQSLADGANMHVALVDTTTSKVLHVTEESSNQPITSGNPVQFNSDLTYASNQPTA